MGSIDLWRVIHTFYGYWPFITHLYFMWAILKFLWNSFVLVSTTLTTWTENNFLYNLYIRGKNEAQMTIDDPFLVIVKQIDVDRVVLC